MNEIKKIVLSSITEIKKHGIRSYFRHVNKKLKRKEFYIIDEPTKMFSNQNPKNEEYRDEYDLWILKHEPTEEQLRTEINSFKFDKKPLISVIMPVFNVPIHILEETVLSVKNQNYSNLELCIANGSTDPKIKNLLEKFKIADKRIKIKNIVNKGISGNTNEALSLATGEFVVLLDHDDTLSPFALFEVAKALNQNKNVDFIYSDSDKITEQGKRHEPFFKPDWSPEIMLSSNYATHLSAFRKQLITEVGGFSSETDLSQDWDMILKITERSKNVYHIPKVLYHWRTLENSGASTPFAKPFVGSSQIVAVTNHLFRKNIDGYIIHGPSKYLECKIQVTTDISIIIPIEDLTDIKEYLDKIMQNTLYPFHEIILVGNKTINMHDQEMNSSNNNKIKFHKSSSESLSDMLNEGASLASGALLVFLSMKLEPLTPRWLEEMAGWGMIEEIGCVGAKIVDERGIIKHSGVIFDSDGSSHYIFSGERDEVAVWTPFGAREWYRDFNAVTGECIMIRKNVFTSLGGFKNTDEYDLDLCLRLRDKNFRIMYTPHSKFVIHGKLKLQRQVDVKKYTCLQKIDPYYTPNLDENDVTKLKI